MSKTIQEILQGDLEKRLAPYKFDTQPACNDCPHKGIRECGDPSGYVRCEFHQCLVLPNGICTQHPKYTGCKCK